ncbi:hypothetical protein BH11BAC3_BH11BAC3_34320 [soil metagenome]
MHNKMDRLFIVLLAVIVVTTSCNEQKIIPPPPDYSFTEEFDTVSSSISRGWIIANNSKPIGTASWKQGIFYYENKKGTGAGFAGLNASKSGTDFIMTSSDCGYSTANCSNWLISPEFTAKDGDKISFYTRTYQNPATAADRLQVRINEINSSADVGVDSNSIGNFKTILLDINPALTTSGADAFPGVWTLYELTITGIAKAQKTRVAFRYYVTDGGPAGKNGLGIGIDRFKFIDKQ